MSLNEDDVIKIAHLARLQIEKDAIPHYAKKLSNILELVEQISQANTDQITPMAHPLEGMTQRLREDIPNNQIDRDLYQENATKHEAGLYLVPQVIGEA